MKSFKFKVILSYAVVLFASFALTALFLQMNLSEDSLNNIRSSLTKSALLIETQLAPALIENAASGGLRTVIKDLSSKIDCRITVIGIDGNVLADSEVPDKSIKDMENHIARPEIRSALEGRTSLDTRYSSTLKKKMLYAATPIMYMGKISGVVRLALPLASVEKTLSQTRNAVFTGLMLSLLFAILTGSILAAVTIKPINRMIEVSRSYSKGDFSRRIMVHSKDETGELANTLNMMAEKLECRMREIASQNRKLAAIFTSMAEGVIVIDNSNRIVSTNPAIDRIFGICGRDAAGRSILESIRNNDISEIVDIVLNNKSPVSKEICLVHPVRGYFRINAVPVFDDGMSICGALAVIHDITEIKRLEKVRSDFVANVSHELKTPLTSIKGFIETLLDGALEDKEHNRDFLKTIEAHTDRLGALVDDLLSLSYLESREMRLEKRDIALRDSVENIIRGFGSQLKAKSIEIRNEIRPAVHILADPEKLGQIFTNLLDNAIKFNKTDGSIRIYCEEIGSFISVSVEDTGPGIPEMDLPRIFERFYRVDKARSREAGGTGLGLSIVKHIVELHGGTVGVRSTEGIGSRFFFTIPR